MEESFGCYCKEGTEGIDVLVMKKVSYEHQQLYKLWGKVQTKLTIQDDLYKELALEGPAETLST